MKRSIKRAIQEETGEIVNVEDLFKTQKKGQLLRKQDKSVEGDDYLCFECTQYLETTTKRKNVFFRHKKGHKSCIYTSGNLPEKDLLDFYYMAQIKEESQTIFQGKRSGEGDRHKFLKNTINRKIKKLKGISDVFEEKVLKINDEIKRPDVYCKYFGKEIVFEIQVSKLSARYLYSRYKFYKKNGIYLIWILDVEIDNQDQFAIDVKHLNEYQNFFKLDEKSKDFKLICLYKKAWIDSNDEICSKWWERSICISQLNYNTEIFQVYFQDFDKDKKYKKIELKKRINKRERIEYERLIAEKKKNQEERIKWVDSWINSFKKEFQKKPKPFMVTNSNDEIIFFAQHDMPIADILSIESNYSKVKWIINACEISYQFDIEEMLQKKLIEFCQIEEVYYENFENLDNKIQYFEKKENSKKTDLTNRLEGIDREIQQWKDELAGKEKYAKEIMNTLIKGEKLKTYNNFESRIELEFTLKVREYNETEKKLNSEIKDLQSQIELWNNSRGRIFNNKILKLKTSAEINLIELTRNKSKILVIKKAKWVSRNSTDFLRSISEFNVEEILANKEEYTFFDDYSLVIDEWAKRIRKKQEKNKKAKDNLLNKSKRIEKKFEEWIYIQIKKAEKTKKELEFQCKKINLEIIDYQNNTLAEINNLKTQLKKKRNAVKNEFKNRFSFHWRDFDLEWEHVESPIFFDTGNEILYLFSKGLVGKFQYDEIIRRFNK